MKLAAKLLVILYRVSRMVTIRHDDVIDGAVTENHGTRLRCHRRGINKNLMFPNCEEESIEIQLLLLRKPGPLPDTGKELSHCGSRLRLRLGLTTLTFLKGGDGVFDGF